MWFAAVCRYDFSESSSFIASLFVKQCLDFLIASRLSCYILNINTAAE